MEGRSLILKSWKIGPNAIKLFTARKIMNVFNKLVCLLRSGLSSVV